jgi:type I restriction enzyme S subunit
MIANLQPYLEYKESGLPWLGGIPRHWNSGPGFAAFREKQVKNTGMQEKTVLSLSYGRIVVKPPEKLHGLVPDSFETYQIVDPGDIIIRSTDLQNDWNSLRVGLVRNRGIITSAYLCFRTTGTLSPEYGYQLLHAFDLMKVFYGLGSGLRQNLDFGDFKRMLIFVPPPEEQMAMVRFLDYANGRLERAIRAKRKVIALLHEQKQAIIHRAVTLGLDPTVPLKPSGIPWLGDIPKHWDVLRAKYLFREVDERSTSGNEELLSVSHITGVTPRSQKNITMFKAQSYVGHKLCRPGDLVVNTMWAWMAALGVSAHIGIVSPAYAVYRPRNAQRIVGGFIDGLLRTRPYVSNILCRSTGVRASRLRLYPEEFFRLPIILPPPPEQQQIVHSIATETAQLDMTVTHLEREIELLREYRTRLVADVVTGKLDVRPAARHLPAEAVAPEAAVPADDLADEVEARRAGSEGDA